MFIISYSRMYVVLDIWYLASYYGNTLTNEEVYCVARQLVISSEGKRCQFTTLHKTNTKINIRTYSKRISIDAFFMKIKLSDFISK